MAPQLGPYPLLSCLCRVKTTGLYWYVVCSGCIRIPDEDSILSACGLDCRYKVVTEVQKVAVAGRGVEFYLDGPRSY